MLKLQVNEGTKIAQNPCNWAFFFHCEKRVKKCRKYYALKKLSKYITNFGCTVGGGCNP